MVFMENDYHILRQIVSAVSDLTTRHSNGVEKGFLLSFSMCLDALLESHGDPSSFSSLRRKFDGLPSSGKSGVLYLSLLSVCDLAVCFSTEDAEKLTLSLLSLRPSSN